MSLLETLILGSYVYTTVAFGYLFRALRNHFTHRLRRLEKWTGIPDEDESPLDE